MFAPRLLVLAGAASAAVLAPVAAARAADVTVSTAPQLTAALAGASASASPTHVKLNPGTYAGSFVYTGEQPLDVTGAGAGSTGIAASGANPGLWLKSSTASYHVADLGFTIAGDGDGLRISGAGVVERVAGTVVGQATGTPVHVRHGGVTVRQTTLSGNQDGGGEGLIADEPGRVDLADLDLTGLTLAVTVQGKGVDVHATRLRLTGVGYAGVIASDGADVALSDSLVALVAPNAVGLAAYNVNGAATTDLDARRVTLVGSGAAGQAGALTVVQAGDHNTIALHDAVLDGLEAPLACSAPKSGGTGRVSADYSRVPTGSGSTCGKESLVQLHPVKAADPGFADPAQGDFRLKADSPLVDAGDPSDTTADLDLGGLPRPVPAHAGGTARGDLGAFERPAPAVLADPPPAPAGPPAGPLAAPPQVDPGQDPAGPPTTPRDTRAPVLSGLKAGRGGVTFVLSEPAAVTVTVAVRPGKTATRTLVLTAGKHVVARKAVPLRGLRPGAHRLTLVARDGAGNVSKAGVTTLRVPR